LVEFLTVFAIMLVVAAMVAPVFGMFTRGARLRGVARIVANNLITARSMAIANRNIYTAGVVSNMAIVNRIFYTYISDHNRVFPPSMGKRYGKDINLFEVGAGRIWINENPVAGTPPTNTSLSVFFRPTGAANTAATWYVHDGKSRKSITITPATGRVRIGE
jgi:Tfp pilus assembly protein FimT